MYTLANVYNTYEWSWYIIDTDKMVCVYYTSCCCIGVSTYEFRTQVVVQLVGLHTAKFYLRERMGGRERGRERERERGGTSKVCVSMCTQMCVVCKTTYSCLSAVTNLLSCIASLA